ncbi:Osmotin, thaumatin-like protein [Lichtheimia hyalospora FSU 10163]|nr:Osmotin, thaumatin-like protein [Lichtheimia hyalospora FSU 10163]
MYFVKLLSLAALFGAAAAAPSGNVHIVVKNHCGYDLHVGKLTNGQSKASTQVVAKGSQTTYSLPSNWQGRFWARDQCQGKECNAIAGAADPASLAEFTFKGHGGYDYYDLSFVDGFNLPMSIKPIHPKKESGADQYRCGAPTCNKLPSCPSDLQVKNHKGHVVGCQSACSKFGTDEYCCAGAHSTPDTCSPNYFSKAVENACPDAYSYAYDDNTSTYMCKAQGYVVTIC